MHVSYFIGGPLNKKRTETKLNVCYQIIFRDKKHIVHLYEKFTANESETFVCYRYLGPAEKKHDGGWAPTSS